MNNYKVGDRVIRKKDGKILVIVNIYVSSKYQYETYSGDISKICIFHLYNEPELLPLNKFFRKLHSISD